MTDWAEGWLTTFLLERSPIRIGNEEVLRAVNPPSTPRLCSVWIWHGIFLGGKSNEPPRVVPWVGPQATTLLRLFLSRMLFLGTTNPGSDPVPVPEGANTNTGKRGEDKSRTPQHGRDVSTKIRIGGHSAHIT